MKKLSIINNNLTLLIVAAMVLGLGLGYYNPNLSTYISEMGSDTTNYPLAAGLILMMYPPLAKVNYSLLKDVFKDVKIMKISALLNWVVGPILMFALAYIFLRNYPEYMVGIILIGVARCIAMVIVWNDLAEGNREYAAGLVALNTLFQIAFYGFHALFFIGVMMPLVGVDVEFISIPFTDIVKTVLIYLGIPLVLGFMTRYISVKYKSEQWYNDKLLPVISPISLIALLLTIIIMFSMKGDMILKLPMDVLLISIPLAIYFIVMYVISFYVNKRNNISYDKNVAISFTATGNNFELAIAISIAIYGVNSSQAMVGVIGPLIEVPALLLLVRVSFWLKKKYYSNN